MARPTLGNVTEPVATPDLNKTSKSWTHNNNGNMLVVTLHFRDSGVAATNVAVTFGGVNVPVVAFEYTNINVGQVWMGILKNAASGSDTVAASWTGTMDRCAYSSRSYIGATNYGTPVQASGDSSTATVNISTLQATDGLVIDAFTNEWDGTITVGANQTKEYGYAVSNLTWGGSRESSNGGTVTMSWTEGGGEWGIIAIEIYPVTFIPQIIMS